MAQARVRAAQVLVAEAVLVVAAAAYTGPTWLFAGVGVGGIGVLLATFGRVDGRWWYEAALGHRRFSRRRARVAAQLVTATVTGQPPDAPAAWLRTIAPDLRIRPVTGRGSDVEVGVGSDSYGWFGAVAVGEPPSEQPPPVPLADLFGSGPALSSAQLVLGERGHPAFVAVRLSAVDGVEIERGYGAAAVDAAVAAGVHRAARLLHGLGYRTQVLDPVGLVAALVGCNGLHAPPQEHWSTWRSGAVAHTFFAVRGDADPALAARLATAAVSPVVSVTADGSWGVLVRVSAPPARLGRASRDLIATAAGLGVRLRRLDGEHAPAAFACSPSGLAAASLDPGATRFAGRFASSLEAAG